MGRKRKRGCEASRKRFKVQSPFRHKKTFVSQSHHTLWHHRMIVLLYAPPLYTNISLFSHLPSLLVLLCRDFFLHAQTRTHTRNPVTKKGHLNTHVHTHSHAQHARTQQKHADPRIRLTGWLAGSGGSDSAHVDYSTAWRFNQALTDVAVCNWYDNQCYGLFRF